MSQAKMWRELDEKAQALGYVLTSGTKKRMAAKRGLPFDVIESGCWSGSGNYISAARRLWVNAEHLAALEATIASKRRNVC